MKRLFAIVLLLVSSTAMADWKLISTGTAFVVNKNYALTAAHVLEDCDGASIRYKHKEIETDIAALDSTNDLGLLLLAEPLEDTAKFRSGKAIRLGDAVVNYGYPLFGELSDHAKISRGVINSLAGWGNDSRHIQYDAPTQPGNSGGPVLDLSGNIVGVVSSGLSKRYAEKTGHIAQNVNFAVKSFVAEAFLSSNGVEFEKAESIKKLDTADIAEKAETFTVLVACWEGFDDPVTVASESQDAEPKQPSLPAQEPKEKMVSLAVRSIPSDANVYIDGRLIGLSPIVAAVPVGEHTYGAYKEGYVPDLGTVYLTGDRELVLSLIASPRSKPEVTEPEQAEPDNKVTLEKKPGDTCPEGKIQTYKGCADIAKAEAEATEAQASAEARPITVPIVAGQGNEGKNRRCGCDAIRKKMRTGGAGGSSLFHVYFDLLRPQWEATGEPTGGTLAQAYQTAKQAYDSAYMEWLRVCHPWTPPC